MKVISFINQKGGAGKTTTAINTAAALVRFHGKKVLLIDVDPQGNATTSAGFAAEECAAVPTVYEVLKGDADVNDTIRATAAGFDLLPTDIRQSGAEIELSSAAGRDFLLREAIDEIKKTYDYVLIDCPPSLSVITLMALTASNSVIIPVSQFLSLNGTRQLLDTIGIVKKRMNPNIDICGVVATVFDGRKNLDRDVLESIRDAFGEKVFQTKIRNNVSLAEAPAFGQDVFSYKPESAGAADYKALTDEIIKRTEV